MAARAGDSGSSGAGLGRVPTPHAEVVAASGVRADASPPDVLGNESPVAWRLQPLAGDVPWQHVHGHTVTNVDDTLFVIGGKGPRRVGNADHMPVHTLAAEATFSGGTRWRVKRVVCQAATGSSVPCHRFGHAACTDGARIFVSGGFNHTYNFQSMHALDVATRRWTLLPHAFDDMLPRAYHSTVFSRTTGLVYAFGGGFCNGGPYDYNNDVVAVDPATGGTSAVLECSGQAPSPRSQHTATLVGNHMLVCGGYDSYNAFSEVYSFSTLTCTWTKVSTCGRAPVGIKNMTPADFRIKAVRQPMVVFGGQMVQVGCVLGGAQRMKLKCLDLESYEWSSLSCGDSASDAPPPGQNHTATLVGNQVVVLGPRLVAGQLHVLDLGNIAAHRAMSRHQLDDDGSAASSAASLAAALRGIRNSPTCDVSLLPVGDGRCVGVGEGAGGEAETKQDCSPVAARVAAHATLLQARSSYFAAMLGSGMMEAKSATARVDADTACIRALVDFLYSGAATWSGASACDMVVLADQLGVPTLKRLAECDLLEAVSPDNLPSLLQAAVTYSLPMLWDACLHYVTQHGPSAESFRHSRLAASLPEHLRDTVQHHVTQAAAAHTESSTRRRGSVRVSPRPGRGSKVAAKAASAARTQAKTEALRQLVRDFRALFESAQEAGQGVAPGHSPEGQQDMVSGRLVGLVSDTGDAVTTVWAHAVVLEARAPSLAAACDEVVALAASSCAQAASSAMSARTGGVVDSASAKTEMPTANPSTTSTTVRIAGVSSTDLRVLVHYLYTGQVHPCGEDHASAGRGELITAKPSPSATACAPESCSAPGDPVSQLCTAASALLRGAAALEVTFAGSCRDLTVSLRVAAEATLLRVAQPATAARLWDLADAHSLRVLRGVCEDMCVGSINDRAWERASRHVASAESDASATGDHHDGAGAGATSTDATHMATGAASGAGAGAGAGAATAVCALDMVSTEPSRVHSRGSGARRLVGRAARSPSRSASDAHTAASPVTGSAPHPGVCPSEEASSAISGGHGGLSRSPRWQVHPAGLRHRSELMSDGMEDAVLRKVHELELRHWHDDTNA